MLLSELVKRLEEVHKAVEEIIPGYDPEVWTEVEYLDSILASDVVGVHFSLTQQRIYITDERNAVSPLSDLVP